MLEQSSLVEASKADRKLLWGEEASLADSSAVVSYPNLASALRGWTEAGEHLMRPLGLVKVVVVVVVYPLVVRVGGVELRVVRVVELMELVWGVMVCCLVKCARVLGVVATLFSCFLANIFWYSAMLNGILLLFTSEIIVNSFGDFLNSS